MVKIIYNFFEYKVGKWYNLTIICYWLSEYICEMIENFSHSVYCICKKKNKKNKNLIK